MTMGSRARFTAVALGLTAGFGLFLQASLAGQDKPFVRITEEQARAAMQLAIAGGGETNELSLQNTYQKELRKLWSNYENKPLLAYDRQEMQVQVMGGAQAMMQEAVSKIINSQKPTNLVWPGGVSVAVAPFNANAQNVVEIVVTRGTEVIKPIKSNLRSTVISSGADGSRKVTTTVHEGSVVFPNDAFLPGVNVKVEAVLDSGRRLSRTFTDGELRKLN